MMAVLLLIAYIVILVLQIVLLVLSLRKKQKNLWVSLFLVEAIPMLIANGLRVYYDSLPGYGIMPGLSYIREVLYSLGASIVYCLLFTVSVLCCIASPKECRRDHGAGSRADH